jgi:tRNA G18 (ribose-2'-O)-methylase SpoU
MEKPVKHRMLEHGDHIKSNKKYPVIFVLDHVTDVQNVGSIFRLADSFGIKCVYLIGNTPTPPNKVITKISRNTEKYVPWEYFSDTNEAIKKIKENGYKIISAEITDNSIDLSKYRLKPVQKICLVAGSEKNGVSQEMLDSSDDVIHIPMLGVNSSMNVVTALAIISYQIILQMG